MYDRGDVVTWLTVFVLFQTGQAWYEKGLALFDAGQSAAAIEPLRRAVELDRGHARAWKALGVAYARQGNYQMAQLPFRNACELAPRLEDACYFAGRASYALNQFEAALDAFSKALQHDSRPWRVQQGIAQAQEALGQSKAAERHFRTAITLNARAPRDERMRPDEDPRVLYAVFLFRQGRANDALESLTAVIADYPDAARARLEMGRTLYHLGRFPEAATHLERATTLDRDSGTAHLMLARTYLRLGRDADAQRHNELASKLADH